MFLWGRPKQVAPRTASTRLFARLALVPKRRQRVLDNLYVCPACASDGGLGEYRAADVELKV